MHSDSFHWHTTPEVFRFLFSTFDVQKAKEIIRSKPRKVGTFDISEVSRLLSTAREEGDKTIVTMGIHVDQEKLETNEVDLSFPCILIHHNEELFPIDGWHRIAKAKKQLISTLQCVILNKKESQQVTLRK